MDGILAASESGTRDEKKHSENHGKSVDEKETGVAGWATVGRSLSNRYAYPRRRKMQQELVSSLVMLGASIVAKKHLRRWDNPDF